MPLTSPGNDDDTGENHQPTLRKNIAEPVEQTLKQNNQREAAERTAAYLLSADPSLAIASLPPAPAGLDADGDAGDMAALALLLGQVSTLMAGIAARNAQPAG